MVDIVAPSGFVLLFDRGTGSYALLPEATADCIRVTFACRPERVKSSRRRGPVSAEDSAAKRMSLLARCREHEHIRDDPQMLATLAAEVGITPRTARNWLDAEQAKYLASRVAQPPEDE